MKQDEKLKRQAEKYVKKHSKDKKEPGKISFPYVVILIICVLAIGGSSAYMYKMYGKRGKAVKTYESMQTEVNDNNKDNKDVKKETEKEYDVPEKNLDFAKLKEENPDIYAWIYIPETNVDYPLVQHPTNDTYYLMHNLDGSYGYPACLYTEKANAKDFSDKNTVIYGHDMQDGSMFKTLHKFEDRAFFDANEFIYVYTENTTYVYKVYAAYKYSNIHLLNGIDTSTNENFLSYIRDSINTANVTGFVRNDISFDENSKLITLSTCQGYVSEQRYLVQGVLVQQ